MKAKWHGKPYHDHGTRKWLVTLELDTAPEIYDRTQDSDLSVEIKKWREKRSLNANAYFHVLVGKIAEAVGASTIEIKNDLICDYGQYHYLEDGTLDWSVKPSTFNYRKSEDIHYQPTDRFVMDKGEKLNVYIVMRGSHTYDSKEMARLIDGTVFNAKELGIETLPPDELERMKEQWKAY